MSEHVYSYDISIFESGYEPVQLCKEIDDSPDITSIVSRINTDMSRTSLMIYFETELTPEEKNALDLIVEAHAPVDRSDYEFDQHVDLLNNRILNLENPRDDLDGANKIYVDELVETTATDLSQNLTQSLTTYADQVSSQAYQDANDYADQTALDILEGRRDFDETQLDINKLSNLPAGGLVGKDARQTLTRKTIDIDNGNNIILNLKNDNIKEGARIDVQKLGDGSVDNTEFKRLDGIRSNVQNQLDSIDAKTDAHSNRVDNPHQVTKTQIGLGKLENIKSNYESTRKPNNLDDNLAGYSVGSIWINRVANVGYVCTSNTEMNASWLEITSLGEITQGLNVGNGVGLYLDKVGATHRFRTMIPGTNVFFQETTNDITIRSRDSHSFLLSPIEIEVMSDTYRGILTFPWLRSEFGAYRSGKIIFEAVVPVGQMSVRLRNVSERSTLGEITDISESGFYELAVSSPSDNARIRVEVMRTGAVEEPDNPRIFGIVLKYET